MFKLVPNGSGYIFFVVHHFAGGAGDGANPYAGVVADTTGKLYGATYSGGQYGKGVVFSISSP